MTLQDLKDNREQIIVKYYNNGGVASQLSRFMNTMLTNIERGTESYMEIDNIEELCEYVFSSDKNIFLNGLPTVAERKAEFEHAILFQDKRMEEQMKSAGL